MKEIKDMTDNELQLALREATDALGAAVRERGEILLKLAEENPAYARACEQIEDSECLIFNLGMERRRRASNSDSPYFFLEEEDFPDA